MRFESIKARGIGPFRAIDIDLAAIPGLLVAVTGKNGAGKSTFLELLGASLYRKTPTRGSLGSLAKTRDALLEVRCVNGASHTVRHALDAVSSKGEAVVMDDAGRPLTDAGKLREYDAFAATHFPSADVLYASTFVAQGSGGFIEASPTERKAVLLRVLGIERLEALAERARKHARETETACEVARAMLDEAQRGALPLDEARATFESANDTKASADAALAAARQRVTDVTLAVAEYERAVETRRATLAAITKLERDVEAARERIAISEELAARGPEIAAARARIVEAEARLEVERAVEVAATRTVEAAERALRDAGRATAERAIIEDRIAALDAALSRARADLAALRPVISRAEVIRAAQKRVAELDTDLAAAYIRHTEAKAVEASARGAQGVAESELTSAKARVAEATRVVTRLEDRLRNEAAVRDAAQAEKDAAADDLRSRRERDEVLEQLRAEEAHALVAKDTRITGLRDTLAAIADEREPAHHLASEALVEDDDAAAKDATAPARCETLLARARELQVQADDAERRVAEHRKLAGQLDSIAQARTDLDAARVAHFDAVEAVTRATTALSEAEGRTWEATQATEVATRTGKDLRTKHTEATSEAADAEALATAEACRVSLEADIVRITEEQARDRDALRGLGVVDTTNLDGALLAARAELADRAGDVARTTVLLRNDRETLLGADDVARAGADLETARRDLARASAEADVQCRALGALASLGDLPDIEDARQAEARASHTASAAGDAVARARASLETSEATAARVTELRALADAQYAELADWNRLAADLGRDGIQALEIDAAGPELTAIANDLLHSCVSRRWTIAIHTQRLSADGKKTIEGCEVEITDVEAGRIGAIETFSGGERVLIGEAVSLALSVLACRRAGVERPTLVRDESGAALDASNGRAYIGMLRRAATLIGASQVLYVTHSIELQELADARIHLEYGTAKVVPVDYVGGAERLVRSLKRQLDPTYEPLAEA